MEIKKFMVLQKCKCGEPLAVYALSDKKDGAGCIIIECPVCGPAHK